MSELISLIDHEIPLARQNLLENHKNLEKVAIYCETNYFQVLSSFTFPISFI